mmetsp:Transcript_17538/g.31442  ORF Transcript_17538/g.31442 Transcript_17538/m.31442 type:complete len:460 (-) Transcript_17538:258-1637(-)
MHRFAVILACLASACHGMRVRASTWQFRDTEFEEGRRPPSREQRKAFGAFHPPNALSAFVHTLSPAVAFQQSYLPMHTSGVHGMRPMHMEVESTNSLGRRAPVLLSRESEPEASTEKLPERGQPGYKRALVKRMVTERSEPGYKRALAKRLATNVFWPHRAAQTNMIATVGMGDKFPERSDRSQKSRPSRVSRRVEGAVWPEQGRFHRFVQEDDPTFEEYLVNCATGYVCKTPDRFQGMRTDGVYQGTSRVQFTLPTEGIRPKTIELLRSSEKDNPSFSAVKVKLPVDATVTSRDSRIVVKQVKQESNAESAMIRRGDIIRAVSVPDSVDAHEDAPWWARMGQPALPSAEEGMVILDGRPAAEYYAALKENLRLNGKEAEVVLIVERPVETDPNGDKGAFGGFFDDDDGKKKRFFSSLINEPEPMPDLVAIPIPVEKDDPSPFPPGYRRTTTGMPPWGN